MLKEFPLSTSILIDLLFGFISSDGRSFTISAEQDTNIIIRTAASAIIIFLIVLTFYEQKKQTKLIIFVRYQLKDKPEENKKQPGVNEKL